MGHFFFPRMVVGYLLLYLIAYQHSSCCLSGHNSWWSVTSGENIEHGRRRAITIKTSQIELFGDLSKIKIELLNFKWYNSCSKKFRATGQQLKTSKVTLLGHLSLIQLDGLEFFNGLNDGKINMRGKCFSWESLLNLRHLGFFGKNADVTSYWMFTFHL